MKWQKTNTFNYSVSDHGRGGPDMKVVSCQRGDSNPRLTNCWFYRPLYEPKPTTTHGKPRLDRVFVSIQHLCVSIQHLCVYPTPLCPSNTFVSIQHLFVHPTPVCPSNTFDYPVPDIRYILFTRSILNTYTHAGAGGAVEVLPVWVCGEGVETSVRTLKSESTGSYWPPPPPPPRQEAGRYVCGWGVLARPATRVILMEQKART